MYINNFRFFFTFTMKNIQSIFDKYFPPCLGVWLSAFSMGFLGPTLAGFLVDYMGFIATTLVFAALYMIMVTFDGTLAFIKCYNYGQHNQYFSL